MHMNMIFQAVDNVALLPDNTKKLLRAGLMLHLDSRRYTVEFEIEGQGEAADMELSMTEVRRLHTWLGELLSQQAKIAVETAALLKLDGEG